jgi:Tol biopolymer transport system component/tRNA A-37 threonylcarbamoyl transferase component Bud32
LTLSTGTRLGPYEILAPIGAGGMGEVYKARDTRLERTVAVKVLPQHLSSSPEVRQRFEREAKTISQFSHSHICALYDVGREGETEYLVMEFLEGETLADRLARGPIPIDQTLRIGVEILAALDAAHRSGIVHRDLKPGNVMLTKSGVKLLDFGLAKLAAAPVSGVSQATSLPTALQESQPLTTRGTILGTFQYMAPEQLEGGEAEPRSDIFAFGCVLYEMLTGQKAFSGKSQASLIGSIMNSDPAPISSIQPMIPASLDRIVKGCLAKEPEHRWSTAHDVMLQLQWIAEGGSLAGVPAPVVARRKNREKLAWGLFAAALLAAAALAVGFVRRAPKPAPLVRFDVVPPPEVATMDVPRISPDGRFLAFDATDMEGKARIWVRALNSLTAQPLAGTDGGVRPFWSPDSRYVGFIADGVMKKVDVTGGPPTKICDAPGGSDGTWSPAGVILWDGSGNDPLYRVSAAGGTRSVAVALDTAKKETSVGWPQFLPDGKHFIYLVTGEKPEDSAYWIGSIDSKDKKMLAPAQTLVQYAPPGQLLFVRDRTLVAQPFDASALKITGEAVPLAEKIGTDNVGLARFSVSGNGVLAYRTGETGGRLLWRDRSGKELDTLGDPGDYANPTLSPSGDRLAFNLTDPRSGKGDIWIRDLARGVNSRFTLGAGNNVRPVWSPDASAIVFASDRGGAFDLYEKSAKGAGEEKLLLHSDDPKSPASWTKDGKYVAYSSRNAKTQFDLWALPTSGDKKPMPIAVSPFSEQSAMFSPDGRYVAYVSNESGRDEIYVQTFPEPGGKWQVSNEGGNDPSWREDGKEIYYRSPDQKLMAVEIHGGADFQAGVPQALFPIRIRVGNPRNKYTPYPDGQRFMIAAPLGRDAMSPTTIVLNWPAGLGK